MCYQVRDELEQLLDDDDDMADLYLSRKSAVASSPASDSGAPNWFPGSPTIGSKISRTSKTSAATTPEENDVEELEMLLEVINFVWQWIVIGLIQITQFWDGYWIIFAGLLYANRWHPEQIIHGKHHTVNFSSSDSITNWMTKKENSIWNHLRRNFGQWFLYLLLMLMLIILVLPAAWIHRWYWGLHKHSGESNNLVLIFVKRGNNIS